MKNLICNSNFLEALDKILETEKIALDTETTGLRPYKDDTLFSINIATAKEEFYFDIRNVSKENMLRLQEVLDRSVCTFMLNSKFDLAFLKKHGLICKNKVVDIQALARIDNNLHKGSHLSMDYLAEYYLGEKKDTTVANWLKKNKSKNFFDVPIDIMCEYGCKDARITYDLGERLLDHIYQKNMVYCTIRPKVFPPIMPLLENEIRLSSTLFDMRDRGMLADIEYITKAYKKEHDTANEMLQVIKAEVNDEFNPNSTKQLAEYIVGEGYYLPKKPLTEKMKEAGKPANYQVDAEILESLDLPVIKDILKMRECLKKADTYYANYLDLADKNNIIHCSVNQAATVTGRTSSSGPNLQNVNKEEYHEWAVRNSFIAREGYTNYFFDYKQQEMMFMLDQAGEKSVISEVRNGLDFYSATAKVIEKLVGISISRTQAKAISLGLAYGQGVKLLASNLNCSVEEARKFKKAYFEGLPNLQKLQQFLVDHVEEHGMIFTPFGRILHIDKQKSYKALNAFVQGSCADIMKYALVYVNEFLKGYKSNLLLTVHDELIVEIRHGEEHLIPEIRRLMVKAYPSKFIPLGVDVEVSETSWAAKKKLDI